MKCQECNNFQEINNTNTTGQGICSAGTYWSPVNVNDECGFMPTPFTCENCGNKDEGLCFPEIDGKIAENCCGFYDQRMNEIGSIILDWKIRGMDYQNMINKIINNVEKIRVPSKKDDINA